MATAIKEVCEWVSAAAAAAATLIMGDVDEGGEGRPVTGMAVSVLLVVGEVVVEESAIPERGGLVDVGAGEFTTVTVTRVGSVAMMVTVRAGSEVVAIPETAQGKFDAKDIRFCNEVVFVRRI